MNTKLIMLVLFSSLLLSRGDDEKVVLGLTFINGKEYESSLEVSMLTANDVKFRLGFDDASKLVLEKAKVAFGVEYKVVAISLLRFEEGQVLQVLLGKEYSSFGKRGSSPALYCFVTNEGEVILPKVKK